MNKSEEIFASLAGRITSGELTGRLPAEQDQRQDPWTKLPPGPGG